MGGSADDMDRDPRLRVLTDVIAPLVRADGGELYLVELGDGRVRLHLAGRFAGCPGNTIVTRRVIEPALSAAAPGTEVVVSSGSLIPDGSKRLTP